MQLLPGLGLGLGAHPVQRVDVLVHRVFNVVHHLQRCCLARRRKLLRRVDLTERFAQGAVGGGNTALPARALLRLAAQDLAVKVELLLVQILRQRLERQPN